MPYFTTITKKGQITIPKDMRAALNLTKFRKIFLELAKNGKEIKIMPSADFLEVAKNIKVNKKENPLKARQALERSYERF